MTEITVNLDEIEIKTATALVNHGAKKWIADEVAKAVRVAEAEGNKICGLYYLESYYNQLKSGRVDGKVDPQVKKVSGSSVYVDAKLGFAQPNARLPGSKKNNSEAVQIDKDLWNIVNELSSS